MPVVQARVNCSRCKNPINKAQTIFSRNSYNEKEYTCFNCYNINKNLSMNMENEQKSKVELYCERCKYRFKSRTSNCPYCNTSDMVSKGNVTMKDLAIERFI